MCQMLSKPIATVCFITLSGKVRARGFAFPLLVGHTLRGIFAVCQVQFKVNHFPAGLKMSLAPHRYSKPRMKIRIHR